MIKVTFNLAY